MTDISGWIYIPNWDDLQHYSDRRPSWIKLYLDLLDNDDFNELTFAQRGVLIQVWILSARVGNGRLAASTSTLRRYLQPTSKADSAHLPRTLERLSDAGFIEIRASKALATRYQRASPDLREEKEKRKSARESGSPNGAAPHAERQNFQIKPYPWETDEEFRGKIAKGIAKEMP